MLHLLDTDEWSRDGDNLDNGHGQEVDVKQNLKNGKSSYSQSCETESLEDTLFVEIYEFLCFLCQPGASHRNSGIGTFYVR